MRTQESGTPDRSPLRDPGICSFGPQLSRSLEPYPELLFLGNIRIRTSRPFLLQEQRVPPVGPLFREPRPPAPSSFEGLGTQGLASGPPPSTSLWVHAGPPTPSPAPRRPRGAQASSRTSSRAPDPSPAYSPEGGPPEGLPGSSPRPHAGCAHPSAVRSARRSHRQLRHPELGRVPAPPPPPLPADGQRPHRFSGRSHPGPPGPASAPPARLEAAEQSGPAVHPGPATPPRRAPPPLSGAGRAERSGAGCAAPDRLGGSGGAGAGRREHASPGWTWTPEPLNQNTRRGGA